MKFKLSFKKRIFIMTIAPMMIAILLLTSYYFYVRMQDLENNLHIQGQSMVKQLVQAGRYPILTSNIEELYELTKFAQTDNYVDSVAIFDKDKNLLAYNGLDKNYLSSEQDLHQISNETQQIIHNGDKVDFISPITINVDYLNKYNLKLLALDESEVNNNMVIGWVSVNISYAGLYFKKYQTISALLLILLFSALICIVFSTHLSKQILTPCKDITLALKDIAAGLTTPSLPLRKDDEFNELINATLLVADTLNQMRSEFEENLDQATHDIRQSFETIELQNIELSGAQKKILKASSVKSEFISNISHEIRTPMNSIFGFTKLLLNTHISPMQRDYLTTIFQASENLLVLLNNVLDFSKIESGKLRLERVPMNLRDCIEDVLLSLSHPAQSKQVELIYTFSDDVPSNIIGDPLRIKQILTNILGNAIKYTDAGSIIVRILLESKSMKEAEICISITDTGSGLSKEKQEKILDALNQSNPTISTELGDAGLGLVISKNLLDQMRGRLTLESQQNKGSTFLITFICETTGESSIEHSNIINFSGINALVYEQHPVTRYAVTNQLDKWGINCDETSTAVDAIKAISSSSKYNLIILGMHQAENFTHFNDDILKHLTKKVRSTILVLTNSAEQHLIESLKKVDIATCLAKPILQHPLLHSIEEILEVQNSQKKPNKQTTHAIKKPLKGVNILTIDDNIHNNHLVSTMLERLGAIVTVAEDGSYGVLLASKHAYDIILMDLRMPTLDGYSATKLIRKPNCLNYLKPVIAVSAHITADEKPGLIEAGFTNYVTKPITQERLLELILKYLRSPHPAETEIIIKNEQTNLIKSNKHIDLELGKKLAGGKEQLAIEMLEMLSESIPEDIAEIKTAYQEKAYQTLLNLVHRFHGAVCYAGTPLLKQLTEELELNLKNNQRTQVDETYLHFIEEINIVQKEISMLGNKVSEND